LCNSAPAARARADESTAADDRSLPVDRDLALPWLVTRACIPELRRSRGNVIFLASASDPPAGTAHPGNIADLTAYATGKAKILRLAIALANELSPDGIRVNTLRKAGCPEDIAAAALFLASGEAAWVTGTDLRVDLGWLAPGAEAALMRAGAD
jgi:NAD(P)-dependent dehydrogenase (short-subunit alcohol dehydrogenase family)